MIDPEHQPAAELREAYLAEVALRLDSALSPLESSDSLREFREHIDAIAAAYQEMGMNAEGAMRAALERFGDASEVGRNYAKTALRHKPTFSDLVLLSLGCTVTVAVVALAAFLLLGVNDLLVAAHLLEHLSGDMGAEADLLLGLVASFAISPFAFAFRRWKPTVFGGIAAGLLALYLAVFDFPASAASGTLSSFLPAAGCLIGDIYILAVLASRLARVFSGRLGPKRPFKRPLRS